MAAGWRVFKGESPYPELSGDDKAALPHYGPKVDRKFRIPWIEGRRDTQTEREMMRWIGQVSGQRLDPSVDFGDWLKDGQVLCKLMESIEPHSIPKNTQKHQSNVDFNPMEFVLNFRTAASDYGVSDDLLFGTSDLWDSKNLPAVLNTLKELADMAHQRNSRIPRFNS